MAKLLVFAALLASSAVVAQQLRVLTVTNATNPSFTMVSDNTLFLSQFTGDPFAKDGVSVVDGLQNAFPDSLKLAEVLNNITWPNTINKGQGFSDDNVYLIAGGFLVPPKSVGAVHAVGIRGTDVTSFTKLTTDKGNPLLDGWFYHKAISVDMNGDGALDVLTARATKPLLGDSAGEMLWLEHPQGSGAGDSGPWAEHSLASGALAPDVFFELSDLNGDGLFEIVYTTFFSAGGGSFSVLFTEGDTSPSRWTNASAVRRVAIDTSLGTMFGVQAADLNADGRTDFLVTNHVDNATLSGVYAYESPVDGDFTNASKWRRHTLANGFPTRIPGPGQASPGLAIAVHPRASSGAHVDEGFVASTDKPVVLVAGDGEERFHLLQPQSQVAGNWSYARETVYDCKGTVGAQTAGDFDGDGWTDVLLPCYDVGTLVALTFAPSTL